MGYRITNTTGRTGGQWDETYETRDAAAQAIADALGWDAHVQGPSFTAADGDLETTARCVYPTQTDCDADDDGAYAPRVVRIHAALVE